MSDVGVGQSHFLVDLCGGSVRLVPICPARERHLWPFEEAVRTLWRIEATIDGWRYSAAFEDEESMRGAMLDGILTAIGSIDGFVECRIYRPTAIAPREFLSIEPPPRPGVYFIGAGDRVKIGKANNIRRRLRELRTASPSRLELLGFIEANDLQNEELRTHAAFLALRTHGEWFHIAGTLRNFLIELNRAQRDPRGRAAQS